MLTYEVDMSRRSMANNRPERLNKIFKTMALRTRRDELYFANKEHGSIVDLVLASGAGM